MRNIDAAEIRAAVMKLAGEANLRLPAGSRERLERVKEIEKSPVCRDVYDQLVRNLACAAEKSLPICQDTGMAVVFLEIGQDVHVTGGDLYTAVNDGVADGYKKFLLRMSVVEDPLRRVNTGTNTPAIIHTAIVPGENLNIIVAPKGFGSENMGAVRMFTPAANMETIIDFVVETVSQAGSNPCPPIIVGVGIGGDFEYCPLLAKRALLRPVGGSNPDDFYRDMEEKILTKVNALGIGACGFGGSVTALSVNIETFATHIAGLPVAVNIGCHVNRHANVTI